MAQEMRCLQCGARIPVDAPEGLCPQCLMQGAIRAGAAATLESAPRIDGPGTVIGRYELLELIGEGGMGLVYLAEQKEPVRRKVALKIIKPGMDSRQVIARFEAERQALALLDHPNIAHVFDAGGTETGRPYFVMEYVRGLPITRYCDDNKLTIEQRLRLFEQVCEAVHHAHQKGIIHRDLKPSNILVSVHDDQALPKIIDFGIAKATTQPLTDKALVTFQGQLLGTPEYMSPEQVDFASQDIDTRSDIYSLGVVLYELLAGVLPFESELFERAGLSEIQQTIREQEPASPSLRLTCLGEKAKVIAASRGTQVVPLARRLHRELEWIPLKAMRKDRCRRYKSASEMASDIRNYLNGNPLLAGPETTIYRVQKFVSKHAGSVATVALVAAAIVVGLIVSTAMYFRAESIRVQAEQAKEQEASARTEAEAAREKEAEARVHAETAEAATKEKAEDLRRTLYVNSIQLADAKYGEGNIGRVRSLLDSCPEDLRGWEWNRLNYVSDQSLMTLTDPSVLWTALLSRDGKRIMCTTSDGAIRVWDAATGSEAGTLGQGTYPGWQMEVRNDGKYVAAYDNPDGNTIKIWDLEKEGEPITLAGHEKRVVAVAWSPDGTRIASGSWDHLIRIWDSATGKELMTLWGHRAEVLCVAFSPDGRRLASGSNDYMVATWDLTTGAGPVPFGGHESHVNSVAFSPNGERIVSGGDDNTVRVWDARKSSLLMTLRGHDSPVASVRFSPDGKRIVSGGGYTIKVWDANSGTELMTLRGHKNYVDSVGFSADGKRIFSCSRDGTVKIWDAAINREATSLCPDDRRNVSVCSVAVSPDGLRFVAGSGGPIKVYDTATMTEVMTMRGHGHQVTSVAFNSNGTRLVSGSVDGTAKVWDARSGSELVTFREHKNPVSSVCFSPDGKQIVSSSYENALIKVWDSATGDTLMTLHHPGPESVVHAMVSPDGKRIASGGSDKTVKLWDAQTGAEITTFRGHGACIWCVTFSPNGRYLASGSDDKTIKIWDVESGKEVATFLGHRATPRDIAFTPDGRRLVSSGLESAVRVWDVTTGVELMTLQGHGSSVLALAIAPDGKRIASGDYEGGIKIWDAGTPSEGHEARRIGYEAREIVDELHRTHRLYSDVMAQLQDNASLDPRVRGVAQRIVGSRIWWDPWTLASDAWHAVISPDKTAEEYRRALTDAQKADALQPNNSSILTWLAGAQYRTGAYEEALKALERAEKLRADPNQGDPSEPSTALAFAAMALHRIGRTDEAKSTLERLRIAFKNQVDLIEEMKPLIAEAEGLLSGAKK
jgi:WD40 repeat protein/serine/threonine protein kinase